MNERAMTADGYIKDQDYTDDIPYGYWPSSFNGCGWIAVYNFMHGMGMPDSPETVYADMLRILPYEGRRGTPFPTMAEFFRKRGIPASRHYGEKGLLKKISGVPAGIVRYVGARRTALRRVCPDRRDAVPLPQFRRRHGRH